MWSNLVRATRHNSGSAPDFVKKYVNYGASVRAAQFIVLAAKARALTHHRYHVAYEDITALATPVLRHRILLNFHAESDRIDSDEILRRLIEHMPPPACKVAQQLLAVCFLPDETASESHTRQERLCYTRRFRNDDVAENRAKIE